MLERLSAICALGVLLASPAFGQAAQIPALGSAAPMPGSSSTVAERSRPLRLTDLLGAAIVDADHEVIGIINDLLFDPQGGARTAVIGLAGFRGLGEKDVAVPATRSQSSVSFGTGPA